MFYTTKFIFANVLESLASPLNPTTLADYRWQEPCEHHRRSSLKSRQNHENKALKLFDGDLLNFQSTYKTDIRWALGYILKIGIEF